MFYILQLHLQLQKYYRVHSYTINHTEKIFISTTKFTQKFLFHFIEKFPRLPQ